MRTATTTAGVAGAIRALCCDEICTFWLRDGSYAFKERSHEHRTR